MGRWELHADERLRAASAASAALLAEVSTALFRSAFERWTDGQGRTSFGEHPRAAAAELAASLSAATPVLALRGGGCAGRCGSR